MSRIRCSVNNCHYWAQGNDCHASEILVTSDAFGSAEPDSFDAPEASTANPTPATTCMETCCKTFVRKDDKSAHRADGVVENPTMS
ncbi:MAG: DUF1540 domain-containing protein [Syntrophothermus sp.]